MSFAVPEVLTFLFAWFATMGGIWTLFDRAESVLRKDVRERISAWLRADKVEGNRDWPLYFIRVFDNVFGERHLSLRCLRRSAVASFVSVGIVLLIAASVMPKVVTSGEEGLVDNPGQLVLLLGFGGLLINVVADYLSLLETRILLPVLYVSRPIARPAVLLLDLVLTTAIFLAVPLAYFLVLLFLPMVVGFIFDPSLVGIGEALTKVSELLQNAFVFWKGGDGAMFGLLLYSTFFTSVWLWLFLIAGTAVRTWRIVKRAVRSSRSILDTDKKPLRSLGFVAMVLVSMLFAVLPFLGSDV